jgi:HD-like signal output (HDOD) protein/CheY-like chemotaxis protein
MAKPNILFVDDEENILEGLRLSLRPMRSVWNMYFAKGGVEALEILSRDVCDVIVSDFRMPGLDGVHLLQKVQQLYPECARIILSGYSDYESVLKTVRFAHQYLNKPCRQAELIKAIESALRLRRVQVGGAIKSIVTGLDALPVLPKLYNDLVMALQNENVSPEVVGDIVGSDIAMSASILRLVNSAFFGLPSHVSSIHHAVNLLGVQTIRGLVLTIHLFSALTRGFTPNFSVKLLWEHSIRVALFAKALAQFEGMTTNECDDSFIAGMLHDIGKLVVATNMQKEFSIILEIVRTQNDSLFKVEKEVIGTTHAEVGAYLLGLWGFNNQILEGVCLHHSPEELSLSKFSTASAVMFANYFDHKLVVIHEDYLSSHIKGSPDELPELGERVECWRNVCLKILEEGSINV